MLWILRIYNYLYFSLLAIFFSYLPVYYSYKGLSDAQIGVLLSFAGLVGILSQALFGVQSDKAKTVKKVILGTLAIAVIVGTISFHFSTFTLVLLLVGLFEFFLLPVDPLTESLNYRVAETKGVSYGSIRMAGSFGYASTAIIVGYLLNAFGMSSLNFIFLGYGLLTFIVALCLPDAPASAKPIQFKELGAFIKYPKTLVFLLLVLITAIPQRSNDSFLGIYLQHLGGSTSLVGQALFLASMSETVFFAISYRFLKKSNEMTLIAIASAFFVIRFLGTAFAPSPQWIACLQLLHGCTFVVFYTASIQYLYSIVPEEWRSTGQTILSMIFFGVSGIIGSFAGGFIFNDFGGKTLYICMGILSLVCMLFALMNAFQRKSHERALQSRPH